VARRFIALAALGSALFSMPHVAATAAVPGASGTFAGRVAIGEGRQLYTACKGRGTPTVMLEAGLRNRGDIWSTPQDEDDPKPTVFDRIARVTRVCEYDRPGTTLGNTEFSRSTPLPQPRTTTAAADDLRRLVRAARLPGPYVVAGHSTGGLIIRNFAARYPRLVAGIVEVDAIGEFVRPPLERAGYWPLYNQRILNDLPASAAPELRAYADLETIDFPVSFRQIRAQTRAEPLRSIPYVVLSHGQPFDLGPDLPADFPAVVEDAWTTLQDDLADLLPRTPHVVARRSGHYVQLDQPELVIGAIERVVRGVRRGANRVTFRG
jgi:pimeloyl-ACP methyl ester carboxylesterase